MPQPRPDGAGPGEGSVSPSPLAVPARRPAGAADYEGRYGMETRIAAVPRDAYEALSDALDEALGAFRRTVETRGVEMCGSEALGYAVAAGLPPQMAYTVSETSRYTGVSVKQLYRERDEGRMRFVLPEGNSRGALISVKEVDRWMRECCAA